MVQTDAPDLQRNAIQKKSLLALKLKRANARTSEIPVFRNVPMKNISLNGIQIGMLRRPKVGIRKNNVLFDRSERIFQDDLPGDPRCYFLVKRIMKDYLQVHRER